jgi:ubiquinone/menaquinone biosynthesis C-methylase UbiE
MRGREAQVVRRHSSTNQARRMWDRMAPGYDRSMRPVERLLEPLGRQWVCSRATGRVLEVAVGTGRNFAFYPPDVKITGLEISPKMLDIARQRAGALGRRVDLIEGDAQALPFVGGSFDTVVCTLSLCNVPDLPGSLAEMARVLQPDGRLLLLDHVASRWLPLRALQRLADLVTVPVASEHFTRRPISILPATEWRVVESERRKLGIFEWVHARR